MDFIIEQCDTWKDDDIQLDYCGCPSWKQSVSEIGNALQASSEAHVAGVALDMDILRRLRDVVVRKLIRPMLSDHGGLPKTEEKAGRLPINQEVCVLKTSYLMWALGRSLRYFPDPAYMKRLQASGAIEVTAVCWYYAADYKSRQSCTVTLQHYYETAEPDTFVVKRVMGVVSAENIAERCKEMVQDAMVPRNVELDQTITSSGGSIGCARRIRQAALFCYLANEAIRQDEVLIQLVGMPLSILLGLFVAVPDRTAIITEYVKLGVLDLFSEIFVNPTVDSDGLWHDLFLVIVDCAQNIEGSTLWVHKGDYLDVVRRALEPDNMWERTCTKLNALPPVNGDKSLEAARSWRKAAWFELGRLVGLIAPGLDKNGSTSKARTGVSGGEGEESMEGCWSRDCERNRRADEETEWMLLKCSGCKMARYCSKECQGQDWKKVHKFECKGLRKA